MSALSFRSSLALVLICIAVVAVLGIALGSAVTNKATANAARIEAVMEGRE